MILSISIVTRYLLLTILSAAIVCDLMRSKIPNSLILTGLICAAAHAVFESVISSNAVMTVTSAAAIMGAAGAMNAAAAIAAISMISRAVLNCMLAAGIILAVLFPLYMIHALGAGDVKLLCVCGAFLGRAHVPALLLQVLLAAGLQSVTVILMHRKLRHQKIHGSIAIAAGVVWLLVWGR